MANLSFSGKITQISEPQTGTSAKGEWTKSIVVVEDDAQFPNSIAFDAFNKKEIVDSLEVGQEVEVLYNSKVTEYQGKLFNGLSLWKVEVKGQASVQAPQTSKPAAMNVGKPAEDDLPF